MATYEDIIKGKTGAQPPKKDVAVKPVEKPEPTKTTFSYEEIKAQAKTPKATPIRLDTPEVKERRQEISAYRGKRAPQDQTYNKDGTKFEDSLGKKVGRFFLPKHLEDDLGVRGLTKAEELQRGESRFQNRLRMSEFETKLKAQIPTEPTLPSDYKEPTSFTGSLVEGVKSGYYGTLKPAIGYFEESMGHQIGSRERIQHGKELGDQMTIDFMKKVELQRPEDMEDFLGGGYKDKRYYGRVIGETIPFMATIITSSLAGAFFGGGAGGFAGMFGSAKIIEQGNAYKSMLDKGLAPDEASLGADIYGTASALIEGALGITSRTVSGAVNQEGREIIASSFNKYLLEAVPQTLKTSGKQVLEEGGEEVAQEITQRLITDWWTKEEDIITADLVESFATGVIGSAPFTVLNIPAYKKDVSVEVATEQAKETLDEMGIDDGGDPLNTLAEVSEEKPNEVEEVLTEIQKRDIEAQQTNRARNLLEQGASQTEAILELSSLVGIEDATKLVESIAPEVEAKIKKEEAKARAKRERKATEDAKAEVDRIAKEAEEAGKKTDLEKSVEVLAEEIKELQQEVKDAKPNTKEKATLKKALEEKRKALREKRVVEKEEITTPIEDQAKKARELAEKQRVTAKKTANVVVYDTRGKVSTKEVEVVGSGKYGGVDVIVHKKTGDGQKGFTVSHKETGLTLGIEPNARLKKPESILRDVKDKLKKKLGVKTDKELAEKMKEASKDKKRVSEVEDVDKDIDKKEIISKTKKDEQDKDTRDRADGDGVSEADEVGKEKPDRVGRDDKKSRKKGKKPELRDDSDKPRERPTARLTNEEIAKKVEAVTEISNTGEVLLVGEVTEELREQANQYTTGGESKEGRGILDEYYTNSKIVDAVKSLLKFPTQPIKALEPAVGVGNFLYALPEVDGHTVVTHEINETTARIAKIFHPDTSVNTNSFETTFIDERGNKKEFDSDYDVVIGNPPYGEHRGKYLGLGEEKNITKYEDYFIKRGVDVLKEGGTLAMVVPSGFLRRASGKAKEAIAKSGDLIDAYRFPTGVFEGTDIGTDIVVFRKNTTDGNTQERLELMSNDKFFEKYPDNILGNQKQVRNRFGKMEDTVTGTLDEAIAIFDANKNSHDAVDIAGENATQEQVEDVKKDLDDGSTKEQAKKTVTKAKTEGKKTIKKKIAKSATKKHTEVVSLNEHFKGDYTQDEMNLWRRTQPDGSIEATKNEIKEFGELLNYHDGKWYLDFNYAQGDIYRKMHLLEHAKATKAIDEARYKKQKAKLEAVLPKQEALDDISLAPNSKFVADLELSTDGATGEAITLKSAFMKWIRELPRGSFGNSSSWEVQGYVQNEQVRGADKDRNEAIRLRRKTVAEDLFSKFMKDGINADQKVAIADKYNETYNFYHTPDYSKVPMFADTFKYLERITKKKVDFELRPVQKEGVGRLVNKGVGLLAHDVGFGKTISGVLATNEIMARGWAKKPLIVAPNENVYQQWVNTIQDVVPEAKLNLLGNLGAGFKGDLSSLTIPEGSFTLVTYEGLKRLSFKDETYADMGSKFGYLTDDLTKAKSARDKEKAKAEIEGTAGKLKKGTRGDLYFEDLGFDLLTFDEVHNANHIVSKVKLPKGQASEFNRFSLRQSDLGLKTWLASQYIQANNGGRNVIGLSATPFTNHPLEYYSILSLVADDSLSKMGFNNVNEFFNTFMEAEHEYEFKADGSYQKKTDIRSFKNYRQFRKLLDTYIDFKEGDAQGIKRPNRVQREYSIPANDMTLQMETQAQAIFQEDEKEEGKGAKVLRAINELRKIAFSPYASQFSEEPTDYKEFVENSPKIKVLMGILKQNKKDMKEAGQIVYFDQVGITYMPLVKEYLVKELGYKATEVEIISGGVSKTKRIAIQDRYNDGEVKIVLGSEAIKEGMNLQENTTDMHILALPWNFTQLRQVIGRGWRQGNQWANVRINNYFIEDSIDIFLSQKLENKQRRYEASIKSGDQTVDVGDVNFTELKFDLIKDPETRAKLELEANKEKISQEGIQAKADLAFATRKIEKLQTLDENLKDAKKRLAEEKKKFEEEKKTDPEASDFWVTRYEDDIKRDTKARKEELERLEAKGEDLETLIARKTKMEAEVERLDKEEKEIAESFDERVATIKAELPPRTTFSDDTVAKFVEERKEHNKTFYAKAEEETTEVVAVETVEKPIKSTSGKVVKTKKTTKAVAKKKATPKKKATKDQVMLKILTDSKLTVTEKVDKLLGKKQEGKKFKDVGERVAGSKKENAVIQAVIQHGDDALLKQLADELGTDPIIAQLDKAKILEGVEVPTREVEEAKKTPAWIAGYKVKVFQTISKVPITVLKRSKYNSYTLVGDNMIDDFIAKYPSMLKDFVEKLNKVKDAKSIREFQGLYNWNLGEVKNTKDQYINVGIEVLGRTIENAIRGGGKFVKDTKNVITEIDRLERVLAVLEQGVQEEEDQAYVGDGKWETVTKYLGMGTYGTRTSLYPTKKEAEDSIAKFKKEEPKALEETKAELLGYETDFDKFVPQKGLSIAKQIADTERQIKSYDESIEFIQKKADEGDTYYTQDRVEEAKKQQQALKDHLARLTGQTTAIVHGNFETLSEYDVKDSRFKKSQITMDNLMKVYGFKSAQLGNYMDDASSKEHIVQTMGAMEDMSTILGVDFSKITNELGLSYAIGARGSGNANAHYEPTHNIINLTKKRGDGSFGHEFMHFLDWKVGKKDTRRGKWSGGKGYGRYSYRGTDLISMELTGMFYRGAEVPHEKTFKPDDDVNVEDRRFAEVADWRNEEKLSLEDAVSKAQQLHSGYLQAVADVYRKEVVAQTTEKKNDYYKKSLEYGGGKDTSYWVKSHELWARAFQAYLEDKLEEKGIKNNYLTRTTKDMPVYPQGDERVAYNKKFDELFTALAKDYPIAEDAKLSEPRFKTKDTVAIALTDGGKYLDDIKDRLKIDFDVHFVDNILVEQIDQYVYTQAYGVTVDNTIAIAKDVKDTTVPHHEVVHLTLANMGKIDAFKGLTADEVLLAKAEELGIALNSKNRNFIEEQIAVDFENYVAKKSKPVGKIKAFFDRLIELLQGLVRVLKADRGSVILDYYDILLTGKSVNDDMVRFENEGVVESFITDGKLDISEINDPSFYEHITLSTKDIDTTTWDFQNAKEDYRRGLRSVTKGAPIVKWDRRKNKYYIKDGNHRVVEQMARGKKRFAVRAEGLKFKLREDRHFANLKDQHNKLVDKMHTVEAKLDANRVNLAKALKIRENKNEALEETITPAVTELRKNLTNEGVLSETGEKVAEELGYNPEEVNVALNDYLKSKEEYSHIYGATVEQKNEIAKLRKEDTELTAKRAEIVRKLKQKKARLEQFERDVQRGFKQGVKAMKKANAIRRFQVRNLETATGISSAQRRRLIKGRNFETMNDQDFNNFMQDMIRTARDMTEKEALQQDIMAEIQYKQFSKYDNLRLALGLPSVTAMNQTQLRTYRDALAQYEFGDTFLSKRQIETSERTTFGKVATVRELTKAIKEGTDLTFEDLKTVDLPKLAGYANGLRLSRHSNLLKYVVDNLIRIEIETEQQFLQHRKKIETLAKKARKSRKKSIGERAKQIFVPTDELVFEYIEVKDTKKAKFSKDKGMTKEEIEFGNAIIAFNRVAYDYMKEVYQLTSRFGQFKEKDYMVHIRRSFLEAVKDDGIKAGVSEMFTSQKEAELSMSILDGKTGDIVPYEKWSPFHQLRAGKIKPTQNVTNAHLVYAKTFFKKRSIDSYVPQLLMVLGLRNDVVEKTKEGLPIDGGVENFIKEYINNARGRKISEKLIPKQGSTTEATFNMAITATTLLALGGRIGIGTASAVGEFVVTTASMILSPKKIARAGLRTLQFKQAKKVREGARHYVGLNPLEELMSVEKGLPDRALESVMILFSFGRYISHVYALQANLTPEEWQEAKVSTERLLDISKEQNKFKRGRFHAGSLVGSTVVGRAFGQYLSWAYDIATTTASSSVRLLKTAREEGLTEARKSEYMKDLLNFTATAILMAVLASLIPVDEEDEENRTILFYIRREMNTLWSAFPALIRYSQYTGTIKPTLPIIEKGVELFTLSLQLISQEAYKRDGRGYGIGDKKFVRTARKLFVPVAIQELTGANEKRDTKRRLIEEAIADDKLDASKIAETVFEGWNEGDAEYRIKKIGEITKLYNLHKKYGFDNELVNIILHGDGVSTVNNEERAELMVEYAKQNGVSETRQEILELRKDRNLCTDTKKRTGCFVSERLWKEYSQLLRKTQ
jgi:hypothetical protein